VCKNVARPDSQRVIWEFERLVIKGEFSPTTRKEMPPLAILSKGMENVLFACMTHGREKASLLTTYWPKST
jgi:hypothetical protein